MEHSSECDLDDEGRAKRTVRPSDLNVCQNCYMRMVNESIHEGDAVDLETINHRGIFIGKKPWQ